MILLLLACAQPLHMQYDHGRAYQEALDLQSNLNRPTATSGVFPLEGSEAQAIRTKQQESIEEKSDDLNTLNTKVQ